MHSANQMETTIIPAIWCENQLARAGLRTQPTANADPLRFADPICRSANALCEKEIGDTVDAKSIPYTRFVSE